MNILIAPNSMKGSINAFDFADVVEEAFKNCSESFNIRKMPVADGGDFTGELLTRALKAKKVKVLVSDPIGRRIESEYAVSGRTAIIEMADASGIKLMRKDELNPMVASTYGTGELIADALKRGCSEVLLGIGGSATIDGGTGLAEALGFTLTDKNGTQLKGNGGNLINIERITKPDYIKEVSIKIICDVDNPLNGKNGAAEVFGPQKGATPEMVSLLDKGLAKWSSILENECGKDMSLLKGSGAAGGIALPLLAFFNAEIIPGAKYILSVLNFEEHVKWADLVITGEGKIDSQTLNDKAPGAVALVAKRLKKPVIAIGGSVNSDASELFNGIFSITNEPMTLDEALNNVRKLLFNLSFELARLLRSLKIS